MRHSVRSGFQPVCWVILFVPLAVALPFERVRARSLRVMQSRRMGGAKRYPSMPAQKVQKMMGFASLYPSYDRHSSCSRGAVRPRFELRLSLQNLEGAGKTGCLLHPRSRVRFALTKGHTSIQGSWSIPAFPAQWLYGLLRALPGERLSCLRRLRAFTHA